MKPKPISLSLTYTLIITGLQSLITILPGLFLIEERVTFSFPLMLFLLYLLLTEFFQVFIRTAYSNHRSVSLNIYVSKVIAGLLMIWVISNRFAPQYGLILIMYEIFQFLTFSEKYDYQDTLLYSVINAFFKGIVFNLIISINYPYSFKLLYLKPYWFSFLVLLLGTLLIQSTFAQEHRKGFFNRFSFLCYLTLIAYLIYLVATKELSLFILIAILLLSIITTLYLVRTSYQRKKELVVTASLILMLIIFYF